MNMQIMTKRSSKMTIKKVKNQNRINLNMILVSVAGLMISSILINSSSTTMVGSSYHYYLRKTSGLFSTFKANNSHNTELSHSHNISTDFSIIKNSNIQHNSKTFFSNKTHSFPHKKVNTSKKIVTFKIKLSQQVQEHFNTVKPYIISLLVANKKEKMNKKSD